MIAEAAEAIGHGEHGTPLVEAAHHAPAAHGGIPEIPNLITVLNERWHDVPAVAWLHQWETIVFSTFIGVGLCLIAWRYARHPATIPRGGQNVVELFVESVDTFVQGMLGTAGRRYTPFIGTLFIYILMMNLAVLVPFMKSSTSSLNTTAGLAIVVFGYVQWIGIRTNGFVGYLDHLAGAPRNVVGWALVPIMMPIHVLGEFIKPLSLSLRLGFNVFAEDVLLAVLLGLGLTAGIALHLPVGLPVQLFVVPLVLIFSIVQALVFSLLSTVYISLMLPHEAH